MFGRFKSDDGDAPITDRDDIIAVLQMASSGDQLDIQPKFDHRQTAVVRKSTGRHLEVRSGSRKVLIDSTTATILFEDDGAEHGIVKLWPSDAQRKTIDQMTT